MFYLRQSTASQSVLIGPFVDDTDGNTAETGLTVDAADIRLSKNGANIVAKNSGGGTHDELGYYSITLDATDTDTVGRLQLMVHESGALPVYHEYQVLEEAIFDGLFVASAARIPSDVTAISGDTTAADNLEAALDGTGSVTISADLDGSVGSVTGAINTAAGTITTLDGLDTAQDTQHGQTQTDISNLNNVSAADVNAQCDTAISDYFGTNGDSLSAIPWNSSWDTEVQSECTDALNAYDPPTRAELTSDINGLNDLSAAEVNAEVVDALNTDTYAEPGQGSPGATISIAAKIGYLYKAWRNRTTQTATEYALYADNGTTKDHEAAVSDDGTTFERGKVTTGA